MSRILRLAVLSVAMLVLAAAADAELLHRYSFTSDISDSVGTAHGTVVDAGTTPNFSFGDGMLDLSANTGEGSNGITEDAYVDLPNGIVSAAAAAGSSGAVSFEFWATVSEHHTWQRFADFGTSNNGEDTSASGADSQYILIAASSGRFSDGLEITNHPASNAAEPNVGVPGPLPTGVEHHVVAVFDHNDTTAGPNGTETLYLDGQRVGSNQLDPGFDSTSPIDNNNWLGRSQWNDPVFDGSYNEFRIYGQALDAGHVKSAFVFGPDRLVPEPTTAALVTVMGGMLLSLTRRKRR